MNMDMCSLHKCSRALARPHKPARERLNTRDPGLESITGTGALRRRLETFSVFRIILHIAVILSNLTWSNSS